MQHLVIDLEDGKQTHLAFQCKPGSQTKMLCLRQVQQELCPDIPLTTFKRAIHQGHVCTMPATSAMLAKLVAMGAMHPKSSHALLCSVNTIATGLASLGVSRLTVSSLRQQHVFHPALSPSLDLQNPVPLPLTFPPCNVSKDSLRESYGLKAINPVLFNHPQLSQQMKAYKQYSTCKYHLVRKGQACNMRSWAGHYKFISQYLGFLHKHLGVQYPCFQYFGQATMLSHFISFLLAKGTATSSLVQYISYIRHVLQFQMDSGPSTLNLPLVFEWLGRARAQIVVANPHDPIDPDQMFKDRRWLTAGQLMAHVQAKHEHVMQLDASQGMTQVTAQGVHDVLLGCLQFGYHPPPRPYCIQTLLLPTYKGKCLDTDCDRLEVCQGNKVMQCEHGGYSIIFSHHKNIRKWRKPIKFDLHPDLSPLMRLHVNAAHEVLVGYLGEDTPYMFVNKEGRPLNPQQYATAWKHFLKDTGVYFPPRYCRHIFVYERRSDSKVEGPSDQSAAMIMGNSLREWNKSYHLTFRKDMANQAVQDMKKWREILLQQNPPQDVTGNVDVDMPTISCQEVSDMLCSFESSSDDQVFDVLQPNTNQVAEAWFATIHNVRVGLDKQAIQASWVESCMRGLITSHEYASPEIIVLSDSSNTFTQDS